MSPCAACGATNPAGTKFCGECGAALARACGACGAPVAAGQKFCRECGASLLAGNGANPAPATVAAPVAERRVCSVLFADLVGFTPLSESRDPEEVRELLSRYFEVTRTVIARYGGTVEKFIGDAVMAVWGAPVAAEGDTERAVRAALDVVDAVAALGAEVGAAGLAARAGVVTGEVAVTVGAAGEGMVAGDAVNTAARVQVAAEPGCVLVDATTRRLAVAAVGFEDVGEHLLKGKAAAEPLWRATRVLAGVGGAQRVDGLEAPLTGRDAELRTIKELFHACIDRRTPRMVVATGAAGVGKSRLGWEFEKYVDGLATVVWWHRGRCLSYGDGVAFWALAEAVRARLGIAEEDPTDVAAGKLAGGLAGAITDPAEREYVGVRVGRLLGLTVAGDPGGPMPREELFAGWRTFFERLAGTGPVVLLVEDAQYADAGLLDFLDHLVDWARDLSIFLLVLARPDLEQRRPGFGLGRNRSTLTLDPLDAGSMDRLVDALVPGMPPAARAAITGHAQGVPLFAVETIRSLIDRDVVQPRDGVYRLVGDLGELAVPDSLHALLAARLDALAPDVRALVADAAVLGGSFPAEALVAVSSQDEGAVRAGLAELVRREVLEVSADRLSPQRGAYRFAQQLLRQVAYETLSRRDRKTRHLAVAAHLRATFADDGEEAADIIARHYLDALAAVPDDPDADTVRGMAVMMLVRAAERARRAGSPATAAASYQLAAEQAEAADPSQAARWLEDSAESAAIAADYERAAGNARRAQRLYEAAGQPRAAARARVQLAHVLRGSSRYSEAREELTAALELLRAEPDRDTVTALLGLANVATFTGDPAADALTVEALELGQALDVDDRLMSQLCSVRGVLHGWQGRLTQAAANLREAVRLGERAGDAIGQGRALMNLADTLSGHDPAAAAEAARAAATLVRRVGAGAMLAVSVGNLAAVLLGTGEWDEADEVLRAALTVDGLEHEFLKMEQAMLFALRGETAAAQERFDELRPYLTSEDEQTRAELEMVRVALWWAAADARAVVAHATEAIARCSALSIRIEPMRWIWPFAVRAAQDLGDAGRVRELIAVLDGHPIGHVPPLLRAERDRARARLDGAPLDGPIAALRRIPAPFHLAQALLDRGSPEDVAEASSIAERLGAAPLARRAAAAAGAGSTAREPAGAS